MADHPLRPATRRRLGEPLPHQLADRPRGSPSVHCCFHPQGMPPRSRTRYYPAVGPAIPRRWASSSRVTHPFATGYCYPVRLACVRHAASVRPEPGSNSPMDSLISSRSNDCTNCRPNHETQKLVSPRRHVLRPHPLERGHTNSARSDITFQRAPRDENVAWRHI